MPASILRPLDVARDSEALHAIYGDEESSRYLLQPACASVSETRALLTGWTVGNQATSWAVTNGKSNDAIGRVSLFGADGAVWEIGIMICPAARGRGLGYRACSEAIDHVFDKVGARRIFADVDPDNAPSLALFERLGFKREGYLRATCKTHIGVRDAVIFGMIAGDARPWHND